MSEQVYLQFRVRHSENRRVTWKYWRSEPMSRDMAEHMYEELSARYPELKFRILAAPGGNQQEPQK
jgi:hypothetical protein